MNLSSFSLNPTPLVISQQTPLKSLSPCPCHSYWPIQRTLMDQVQFFIHQYPETVLARLLWSVHPSALCVDNRIVLTQVQHLASDLIKSPEVHMGLLLELVQILLDSSCPSGVSTAPLSLGSSENLQKFSSFNPSMSSVEKLDNTGPNPSYKPLIAPLVTDIHPDPELVTTTVWMWPSSQFLNH